jgi:hypothetical protein
MPELCFGGWKVGGQRFFTPIGSFQYIPFVGEITDALLEAYGWGREHYSEQARAGAMAYDADFVAQEYWKPVLASIAERVEAGAEEPEGMVAL